jgi:hypothetical protein
MRYYIEAYRAEGDQILGNLDGQAALTCRDVKKTAHFRSLINPFSRPRFVRVAFWKVIDQHGKEVCRVKNPCTQ